MCALNLSGKTISIGRNTYVAPSVKFYGRGKITIGDNCRISHGVIFTAFNGGFIEIKNNVDISFYCILQGAGGLKIGNDCLIASHTVIVSANHSFDRGELIRKQPIRSAPIEISPDVWIGAGCKVLAGAQINEGCVIGAGSVVRGNMESHGIYAGVPARKIKERK